MPARTNLTFEKQFLSQIGYFRVLENFQLVLNKHTYRDPEGDTISYAILYRDKPGADFTYPPFWLKFDAQNLNLNGEVPSRLLNKQIWLQLNGTDGQFTLQDTLTTEVKISLTYIVQLTMQIAATLTCVYSFYLKRYYIYALLCKALYKQKTTMDIYNPRDFYYTIPIIKNDYDQGRKIWLIFQKQTRAADKKRSKPKEWFSYYLNEAREINSKYQLNQAINQAIKSYRAQMQSKAPE